jgi:hypothetical protein
MNSDSHVYSDHVKQVTLLRFIQIEKCLNFEIENRQARALQISEHMNQQIDSMQKRIDRNHRRIVYILRKVDELIQQVELKNRQVRSILHGNPDQGMVLMAEDMAADADHILFEVIALNVKADKLKKASEVASEQKTNCSPFNQNGIWTWIECF